MARDKSTQEKIEETRARQEAAGIPDSRPSAAPHPEGSGVDRLLQCHINGVLISELNLDPQVLSALDYWATDEGVAEKNARPNVREDVGRVKLGADSFDKALQQRRDDVRDRDIELSDSRDPLKEVADQYHRPGFRPKFLSENRIKQGGTTGDYEVVKAPNGDPVKVRGMILGHIPEEKARARNRRFQQKGNQLLKQIGETYKREGGRTAVSDQD